MFASKKTEVKYILNLNIDSATVAAESKVKGVDLNSEGFVAVEFRCKLID
jgi:hypothetical protein